jgi:hypothetical protein
VSCRPLGRKLPWDSGAVLRLGMVTDCVSMRCIFTRRARGTFWLKYRKTHMQNFANLGPALPKPLARRSRRFNGNQVLQANLISTWSENHVDEMGRLNQFGHGRTMINLKQLLVAAAILIGIGFNQSDMARAASNTYGGDLTNRTLYAGGALEYVDNTNAAQWDVGVLRTNSVNDDNFTSSFTDTPVANPTDREFSSTHPIVLACCGTKIVLRQWFGNIHHYPRRRCRNVRTDNWRLARSYF